MITGAMGKVAAFCSYAHEDAKHLAELKAAIAPLREQSIIDDWSDERIQPGTSWDDVIKNALERAHLVLFLITPDFLESQFISEQEIRISLERLRKRTCEVIPILIVKPENEEVWHSNPLAKIQPLPEVGMWINEYSDPASAFEAVRFGIGETCKRIGGGDNPYRRSNIGDWRHAQRRIELPTGHTAKWEFTEELVEKTDTTATLRVETTRSGDCEVKRIDFDLEKPLNSQAQSFANQAGLDLSAVKTMVTRADAAGPEVREEVVQIGFESYQTNVATLTTYSDLDGFTMETHVTSWRTLDAPFDGVVRVKSDSVWSNGAKGTQSMHLLGFGYENAATHKPTPESHHALPEELAGLWGKTDTSAPQNDFGTPVDKAHGEHGSQDITGFMNNALPVSRSGPAIFPGHWGLEAHDFSGHLVFDAYFHPNNQLQGTCWNNGFQSGMTGIWEFNPAASRLRIDWNDVAWGRPPAQCWMAFDIINSDQYGYIARDLSGRTFRIWNRQ